MKMTSKHTSCLHFLPLVLRIVKDGYPTVKYTNDRFLFQKHNHFSPFLFQRHNHFKIFTLLITVLLSCLVLLKVCVMNQEYFSFVQCILLVSKYCLQITAGHNVAVANSSSVGPHSLLGRSRLEIEPDARVLECLELKDLLLVQMQQQHLSFHQ